MNNNSYIEIIDKLGIKKADKILMISDLTKLFLLFKKKGDRFAVNKFIDLILDRITEKGTLAIPTHNWDFCSKKYFHYYNTPSMTGSLGSYALKRKDFIRTTNPIYSFAVSGKHKDYLFKINHFNCFGKDSPFEHFHKNNYKYISLYLDYKQIGFTPVHYIEEVARVSYRFFKKFSGEYIDYLNHKKNVEYNLYVRKKSKLKRTGIKVKTDEELKKIKAIKFIKDENYDFTVIKLKPAIDFLLQDLKNNIEKDRLIYPMKSYNQKRTKINSFM